jgi:hypothetical protein
LLELTCSTPVKYEIANVKGSPKFTPNLEIIVLSGLLSKSRSQPLTTPNLNSISFEAAKVKYPPTWVNGSAKTYKYPREIVGFAGPSIT